MSLGHEYNAMTGLTRDRCHWLAYRYEDDGGGFRPERGESWAGFSVGTRLASSFGQRGWMTSIYQTDSRVWVSESAGRVYMNPRLGLAAPWQTFQLAGVLRGIWGTDDDCVFTWGVLRGAPVAYHWNGETWRPVDSPGTIVGMHGSGRDAIVAVGQLGHIARWDGTGAFVSIPSAARGTLSDVHVDAGGDVYACGPDGELVRGTLEGLEPLLTHEAALRCVTGWGGQIWVGSADGLLRLEGGRLMMVKDNLRPVRLEGRGELLITMPDALVNTLDGAHFRGISIKTFVGVASSRPPAWR